MSLSLTDRVDGKPVGFGIGSGGLADGRPNLVLIHGSGGSRASWTPQLDGLGDRFNVIALELPGHGRTPGPLLPTVPDMAAFVIRVLEAWNLDPKPVLGGQSLGGAVTLETALTRPAPLSGIVLAATGANLPVNPALFEGFDQDFDATIRLAMKWAFAKTAPPELVDREIAALLEAGREVLVNDFTACDRFDRREDLGEIDLPTLVVCGRQDKMTPTSLSDFLVDHIHSADKAYIDDAGHEVMLEQPEAFNQAVGDFAWSIHG